MDTLKQGEEIYGPETKILPCKTKQNQTEICLVQATEAEGLQSNRSYKRRDRAVGPKQHDKRECREFLRMKEGQGVISI